MPGSAFAADLQYPDLTRYESTEQKLAAVQDYLFLLLETLRYVLRNLSMEENFNQAELSGWVQTLNIEANTVVSETVITNELYGDFGDIADLTVNELRTDYQRAARYLAGNVASLDYLHVHDEEISFITGVVQHDQVTGDALTEQLHHGTRYFWWKDATHERMTSLEDTGLPVIVYQYAEQVKGRFSFVTETEGGQTNTVPVLKLGYGSDAGGVNGTAKLGKHASGLELSYVTGSGKQLGMWQRSEGYLDLAGLRKPTLLDFSGWDPVNGIGQFTETRDGSIVSTYSVVFDQTGNPVKFIDGDGHETDIRWNRDLTPVAYIESSGTQYINTGFTPDQDSGIEVSFRFTGWYSYNGTVACPICLNAVTNTVRGFGIGSDNNKGTVGTNYCTFTFSYGTYWFAGDNTLGLNTDYVAKLQGNKAYIDGTLVREFAPATFTAAGPLHVFGAPINSSGVNRFSRMRLYGLKLWDDGTLVRDFQPVLDEGGVACLYDAVTDELFYNAGTGSFVAGPAV